MRAFSISVRQRNLWVECHKQGENADGLHGWKQETASSHSSSVMKERRQGFATPGIARP